MSESVNYIVPKSLPAITLGPGSANIGISENHTFENDVVSQPLEDGSSLFDHVIILADELEVVIHTGNTPRPGSDDRYPSQVLFAQLKELRNRRELCDIYTLHEVYHDMIVKSVTVPNVAPFPGRTDITVKFVRVSVVSKISNEFSRDKFTPAVVATNTNKLAASEMTKEQRLIQLQKNTANAKIGILSAQDDISNSAMSLVDLGEGEIFSGLPDPVAEINFDNIPESEHLNKYLTALSNVYDNPPTSALKTAYSTMKNILTTISTAYSNAGNFTEEVRVKLQEVSTGISLISNLSIGAQRFVRTIKGQVLSVESYFDVLTNNWSMNLTDGQGKELIAGAALVLGVNVVSGLNLKYTKIDENGEEVLEDLTLKGIFLSPPVQSSEVSAKGIESSPYAFAQDENGVAPCSILLFDNDLSADAYQNLISGMVQREINFDINDMDYSVLGGA